MPTPVAELVALAAEPLVAVLEEVVEVGVLVGGGVFV